jgi:hypothetical protein
MAFMENHANRDAENEKGAKMSKAKFSSKGSFVFSALLAFIIISAAAAAQPALPCSFYGSASINGRPVPAGSVITAQMDSISRGSVVISSEGRYGGPTLDEGKLHVYDGSTGAEIIFFVQTPSMGNRLEAAQKGVYQSGEEIKLDLTFSGEEIPRSEPAQPAGPGGSGSGSEGGTESPGTQIPAEQPANQGKVFDITSNLTNGNAILSLAKGDEAKFSYNGKDVYVKMKSMSDFAALLTVAGTDMVIGEKGSAQADTDGDGFQELQISVGKVKVGVAEVTFSLLQKPAVTSGPGATGMVLVDQSGLWISLSAIVIIAVVGSGIYLWKRRGVRNEGYQGFN